LDRRFLTQRRKDFTSRFYYTPYIAEATNKLYVLFDLEIAEEAMHATLSESPNSEGF
jgi:hypothetical protein